MLKAIILGVVQGVTAFLPISSTGHLSLIEHIFGMQTGLMFHVLLRAASTAAVVYCFRKEIISCIRTIPAMLVDLSYNFSKSTSYTGIGEEPEKRKILATRYSKIMLMVLIATAAMIVVSIPLRPLAEKLNNSLICSGMGMLLTALLLFTASFARKRSIGVKEAKLSQAVAVGAFQGISVIPGVSTMGMTLSIGYLFGFNTKFARIYSFLLLVPATLGALIYEGVRFDPTTLGIGVLPCVVSMVIAFVVSVFIIERIKKSLKNKNNLKFAIYCVCIGLVSIVIYLV